MKLYYPLPPLMRGLLRAAARAWVLAALAAAGAGAVAAQGEAPAGRIAFAVEDAAGGLGSRLFVANPDGSGARAVTSGASRDRAPAFSPNGEQIAYQSTDRLGLERVVVLSLKSGDTRPLAVGGNPQWSRDGQRILFSRREMNDYFVYAIRADGTEKDQGLKPLTRGSLGRWSPDEKQLAVIAPAIVEGRDRWQLQVMPVDTLEPRLRLTLPESYGQVVSLEWAPDASRLLFSTSSRAGYSLYTLDLARPEPQEVPRGKALPNAAFGSWSPDGKQILFRTAADPGSDAGLSRLAVMNADGTGMKSIWEPERQGLRVQGTAWTRPVVQVAAVLPKPEPAQPVVAQPEPAVVPPMPPVNGRPEPLPAPRELGDPVLLHRTKTFAIEQVRSPVSVTLARPAGDDFLVTVTVRPEPDWRSRRKGVGITLDMADGSLYRGNVIYNGAPWVTIQGREKGGKVRLIDGKQLDPDGPGFRRGFKLTLRREGRNLIVALDDEDMISQPLLESDVRVATLTLENFDRGTARFPLGGIYMRKSEPAADQNGN
ncbi:MAG: TolB family protein [Armatimonadota bacterium]